MLFPFLSHPSPFLMFFFSVTLTLLLAILMFLFNMACTCLLLSPMSDFPLYHLMCIVVSLDFICSLYIVVLSALFFLPLLVYFEDPSLLGLFLLTLISSSLVAHLCSTGEAECYRGSHHLRALVLPGAAFRMCQM